MKFRSGYVSNSSSSSFIVALEGIPSLSLGGPKSIKLTDIIRTSHEWTKETRDLYIHHVWDWYVCYIDDGETKESMCREECGWFEDGLKALDEGKTVYHFDVDYNDETASRIINLLGNDAIIADMG